MASLDIGADYKKVQDKVTATRNYNELKTQYDDTRKQAGEAFEQKKAAVTGQLGKIKEQTKQYYIDNKQTIDKKNKEYFHSFVETNSKLKAKVFPSKNDLLMNKTENI